MNFIKRWSFNKFMENEEKEEIVEAKRDDTNQVVNTNTTSNVDKKIPKKRKKSLLFWLLLLLVIGTVVGLIIYYNVRKTELSMGKINNIQVNATEVTLSSIDKKTYTIDLTSANTYSYYVATNTWHLYADVKNEALPLFLTVTYFPGDNSTYSYGINGYKIPASTADDFTNWLASYTTGAEFSFQPSDFPWFSLISMILPIAIFIILMIYFSKISKMQTGGQEGLFGIGKSGAQLAKSNVKFSDVAGIKEEKVELSEIVDYLKRPQKYAAMGARTPKGVILYGPPGTGKTLLAKAVAGEAGVSFLHISGSQFEDMLVGVGAKRVRDLFAKARKASPAIIFIDEIDSVASKRGKNEFGGGLADQTINQLLAEMDGFNTTSGIVVIAATNRLDVLDDAILRPGRFDRQIQVSLPDIKEREEILKIHSRNKNVSKKVSLYDIARRTPGFSGAQLENVLNEATLLAVREDKTTIGIEEIDEAIDRVIGGPAKKSKVVSKEEKKLIAYHEAGHALVGLYSPGSDVVQKITIIPRGSAAGYTMQTPEDIEKNIQSKDDLLNNIRMTLGGRAAEEVVFGKDKITTGASNDLYKVTNVVRAMVTQLGMTEVGMTQFFPSEGFVNPYQQQKLFSDKKQQDIDNKIEEIIETEYNNAKKIISKNRKELDLIVETLLILETILKDQIDYIHKHKKLPPEAIELKNKIKEDELKAKSEANVDDKLENKDNVKNNDVINNNDVKVDANDVKDDKTNDKDNNDSNEDLSWSNSNFSKK